MATEEEIEVIKMDETPLTKAEKIAVEFIQNKMLVNGEAIEKIIGLLEDA